MKKAFFLKMDCLEKQLALVYCTSIIVWIRQLQIDALYYGAFLFLVGDNNSPATRLYTIQLN